MSSLQGVQKCCRVNFPPETVRGSCRGKAVEISDEILLLLFPQDMKLENAQKFSLQISRQFSRDVLQLQMANFMAFLTLQTFVLDRCGSGPNWCLEGPPHPPLQLEGPALTLPLPPHPPWLFLQCSRTGRPSPEVLGCGRGGGEGRALQRYLGPDPHLGALHLALVSVRLASVSDRLASI